MEVQLFCLKMRGVELSIISQQAATTSCNTYLNILEYKYLNILEFNYLKFIFCLS